MQTKQSSTKKWKDKNVYLTLYWLKNQGLITGYSSTPTLSKIFYAYTHLPLGEYFLQ